MSPIEALALGIGLVLVIEGLILALVPDLYERMSKALEETPIPTRRNMGLCAVALGVFLVWMGYR